MTDPTLPAGVAPRGADPRRRHRRAWSCSITSSRASSGSMAGSTPSWCATSIAPASAPARSTASARTAAAPLFGVPMTVKESFDLAGLPTTWGYEEQRNSAAHEDALAVQRLKAAGAVVFGKTNVPVEPRRLAELQSGLRHHLQSVEPRAYAGRLVRRRRGGDGGGLPALELGSDIGGSIRVPAHYCGVFGHKPTWGLCPRAASRWCRCGGDDRHLGDRPAGTFGRRICRWRSMRSPAPTRLRRACSVTLPPPRAHASADLRVAVWSSEPGQADRCRDHRRRSRRWPTSWNAKARRSSRTARPAFDATEAFHLYLQAAQRGTERPREREEMLARMRGAKARRAGRRHERRCDLGPRGRYDASANGCRLNERRFRIRRVWGAFFRDWDVLLCPVHRHRRVAAYAARRRPGNVA